ncbi:hypothetical protein MCEMSEM29_00119 [Methylophilaceae bacterium]
MKTRFNERGLALLALVFLIAIIVTVYTFKKLNASEITIQRDKNTAAALAEAKEALMGWSIAHQQYPGILPFPDRSAVDGNYDGNADCTNSVSAFDLLIGKLPYAAQTLPCIGDGANQYGISADLEDGSGERLWYAVSRNLIRTSDAPGSLIINPAIADAPSQPWLVVRDKNGQIISNRVAAVIIAPGAPVGGQNRSGGLAGANAYLDSITIAGVTYSNANYVIPNEDFIIGDDMRYVTPSNQVYQQPYEYNDKLIYITIDELMLALNKRALGDAANSLRAYYQASAANPVDRFYPYAAVLGDPTNRCDEGLQQGLLPINNVVNNVASSCTHANKGVTDYLPAWFTESRWQDFMYYVLSNDCSFASPGCANGVIQVGAQANVKALLIATGATLTGQDRPSSNINNYLDSIENTDLDFVFDATSTSITKNYNDQMLIVAP